MAYTPHIYVAVGGRLGTSEQWQTGFRLWSASQNTPAELDQRAAESLDDIEAHLQTWWSACAGSLPGSAHWDFTKVNAIGSDGRYVGDQTHAIFYAVDQAGHTGNAAPAPFQCAVVMSLVTDSLRGYASKGRMYLPAPNVSIDPGTGQMTTSTADNLANATATLFTNINDNPGFDVSQTRVAIMSAQGPHRDVLQVRAGKVMDTQRRRRKGLDENYGPDFPVTGQG